MGGGDPRIEHLSHAVAKATGVEREALFVTTPGACRWRPALSRARAMLAYRSAFDLGLSHRQIAEALGYASPGSLGKAIRTLVAAEGLPPVPARPWKSGKRLLWGVKAPRRPDCPPKPPREPKGAIARKPAKPAVGPPAQTVQPVAHHSQTRMTVPANPAPVTLAALSDRIVSFLAARPGATAQTLATCLDAKELAVGQSLSWLKHQGRLVNDAPDGCTVRDTRWRPPVNRTAHFQNGDRL